MRFPESLEELMRELFSFVKPVTNYDTEDL